MSAIEDHGWIGHLAFDDLRGPSLQLDKRIRIAYWQWFERNHVEEAERRGVHANANRKHQNSRRREAWRPHQRPRSIAQILLTTFDPGPAPGLARIFTQPKGIAKVSSPIARHHLAMKLHIVLQFLIELVTVKQIAQTAEEFTHIGLL